LEKGDRSDFLVVPSIRGFVIVPKFHLGMQIHSSFPSFTWERSVLLFDGEQARFFPRAHRLAAARTLLLTYTNRST